jgi:glycosyltransferase involved in cell wall biosynthesis
LVREADAVFCVSETLVEKHRKLNPNVFLLPNGVDLKLFDLQRASSEPRPRDLPTDRPVLGFVGSLNNHVDFELVMRVAEAFPSCSVVLVGLVVKQYESGIGAGGTELFRRLGQMPNVRILGFKPTAEVPLYMAAFDVCLIPFRQNAFNEACDPLKFYQYSAMGKPIVTTSVKVAYRHRSLCYLAESHDDFITCISKALNERASDTLARQRMALAEAHAWPLIVARACRQLEELGNRSLAAPRGGTSGTQNARPEAAS